MKKHTVLIADDAEINRSWLSDMLSAQYDILEAQNGMEAVALLDKYRTEISIVLLDIMMPVMDGFEVLSIMNKNGYINNIPVITISSETSSEYIDKAYNLGATDYINRPFDENTVQRRVQNTIMLYSKQKMLEGMVTEQILEKEHNNYLMVEILSNIVEFRNGESGQHVLNIRTITELLLRQLMQPPNPYRISAEEIAPIVNASSLHDIGKISIPEEILNKPGKLTKEEFELMKTHSAIGAQILEEASCHQKEPLIQVARDICRWHHERYDGRGYPDGLKGDEIPIAAQVVSLADVYDALTSVRVYKPAFSHEKAMEMILNGECGSFNPVLLRCLKKLGPNIKEKSAGNAYGEASGFSAKPWQISNQLLSGGQASGRTLALLEQERIKYQFFASMSQEIQFEYNLQTDIVTFSEWGAKQLGLKELIVHPKRNPELRQVICGEDLLDFQKRLQKATPMKPVVSQTYLLHVKGGMRWHKAVARPLWVNEESLELIGVIGKLSDIHEAYTELNSFKRMAEQDSLTKLYNHMAARKEIETFLKCGDMKKYALVLLDLDHFKSANDQYGHLFGDEVLKYVAQKLMKNMRREDIVSRIGGDEFMVFISYQDSIELVMERIFNSLAENYRGFQISASMGVALFPEHGRDYDSLFHCADQALYVAKKHGRCQYCYYDESVKGTLSVLSRMDNELEGE